MIEEYRNKIHSKSFKDVFGNECIKLKDLFEIGDSINLSKEQIMSIGHQGGILQMINELPEFKTKLNILEENNNLNRGIDELIEKYRKEIVKCDCDTCRACQTYHKVIQDLKSLKGE